jgi:hypothetical protein
MPRPSTDHKIHKHELSQKVTIFCCLRRDIVLPEGFQAENVKLSRRAATPDQKSLRQSLVSKLKFYKR